MGFRVMDRGIVETPGGISTISEVHFAWVGNSSGAKMF